MYKILSKQNFSVALALLLTILLSQTNVMNFFFSTVLGRTLLVIIILCISYTNNILGVVSTLFVMMIFMCGYTYAENFDSAVYLDSTEHVDNKNNADHLDKIAPTPEISNADTDELDNKYIVTEGSDILGTEQTLQRGKKSNTIMVNEDMRKSTNVDPYDGWNVQSYFTSIS